MPFLFAASCGERDRLDSWFHANGTTQGKQAGDIWLLVTGHRIQKNKIAASLYITESYG
jgi:hypothetical protein